MVTFGRVAGVVIAASIWPAASAVSEVGRERLFGRWTHADLVSMCEASADSVEQPFTLRQDGIVGLEMGCDILSWKRQGPFWRAEAKCAAEGDEWRQDYFFALSTARL